MQPLVVVAAAVIGAPAGWAAAKVAAGLDPRAATASPALCAALCAASFAWAALVMPSAFLLAATVVLGWTLIVLMVVDVTAFRLPDIATLPLAAAGFALAFFLPGRPVLEHLLGALIGYGALALIGWLYGRLRGRDGLGLGDAKLLAAAGAWLGWAALPSVVLLACLGGLAYVAVAVLRRGPGAADERLPFGAPLALAFWIVWLHGPLPLGG